MYSLGKGTCIAQVCSHYMVNSECHLGTGALNESEKNGELSIVDMMIAPPVSTGETLPSYNGTNGTWYIVFFVF